jgi:hypothetical protein
LIITEIKKHNIDTFDIYTSVIKELETNEIIGLDLPLDEVIRQEITQYFHLLNIDEKNIDTTEHNILFTSIKEQFDE